MEFGCFDDFVACQTHAFFGECLNHSDMVFRLFEKSVVKMPELVPKQSFFLEENIVDVLCVGPFWT